MSKVKFEIKNKWTGAVLFEYEKEDNVLEDAVEKAVKTGVNLEEANLTGANLMGAHLVRAHLAGADLVGADLAEANLVGADLRGADLRGAYLGKADLEGANLAGADLEGAYIRVSDSEIDVANVIKDFEEKNNLKITEWYINKNVIPTKWSCFWRYGLIICDYEAIEEVKEMTTEEAEKELSGKYSCKVKIKR